MKYIKLTSAETVVYYMVVHSKELVSMTSRYYNRPGLGSAGENPNLLALFIKHSNK